MADFVRQYLSLEIWIELFLRGLFEKSDWCVSVTSLLMFLAVIFFAVKF